MNAKEILVNSGIAIFSFFTMILFGNHSMDNIDWYKEKSRSKN